MNKIPTAEEFMTDEYQLRHYGTILLKPKQAAIEFAKLHVKAALESACDTVPKSDFEDYYCEMIRKSYPDENVK